MNRKYDAARYYESVKLLRVSYQNPAITTDLIVGFPQETEDEFAQTLDFLRACAFSSMHIFPYSRRPGTPAADLAGQIPAAEKEARAHRAHQVAQDMEQTYLAGLVGQTLPVLFEEEKDGLWQGHAPNYVAVRAAGEDLHNQVRPVRVTGVEGAALAGALI
jgi:threonylcarbamoyladenosine tRNA methylthiotransferase MtaB